MTKLTNEEIQSHPKERNSNHVYAHYFLTSFVSVFITENVFQLETVSRNMEISHDH